MKKVFLILTLFLSCYFVYTKTEGNKKNYLVIGDSLSKGINAAIEESRQAPEKLMHSAPWAKASRAIGVLLCIYSISPSGTSRDSTTCSRPSFSASLAPFSSCIPIWVLACRGSSGIFLRIRLTRPISCTIAASAPVLHKNSAYFNARDISLSSKRVLSVIFTFTPLS